MFAYAGKILQVDLQTQRIWEEDLHNDVIDRFLGGRGINAYLLWQWTQPQIDPLGPDNVLIFGLGALSGTFAPACGRTTVTTKGVLTRLYLKSGVGGHWGPELKYAGYDHLVTHGSSAHHVYLLIRHRKAELRDAKHLRGLNIEQTERGLKEEIGRERLEVASIGMGGEHPVRFASIMIGYNAAAPGGVGTVMGSKKLKAIAVSGNRAVTVSDPDAFLSAVLQSARRLMSFPARKGLSLYGTAGLVPLRNEMNLFRAKNFQQSLLEGGHTRSAGPRSYRVGFCRFHVAHRTILTYLKICPIRCAWKQTRLPLLERQERNCQSFSCLQNVAVLEEIMKRGRLVSAGGRAVPKPWEAAYSSRRFPWK